MKRDWQAEAEAFKAAALREHELMREWQARALAAEAKLSESQPEPFMPPTRTARKPLTEEDIERGKTANGGYNREQLEKWGVPWPPPKGWKKALLEGAAVPHQPICTARTKAGDRCTIPVSKDNPEGWGLCIVHRDRRRLRGKRTYFRSPSMVMDDTLRKS